jgi:hypothetical protein
MNIQDTYSYNSIFFDTTLSDDAKVKRAKQLVDNIIANNVKTSTTTESPSELPTVGNTTVSGNTYVSGNTTVSRIKYNPMLVS